VPRTARPTRCGVRPHGVGNHSILNTSRRPGALGPSSEVGRTHRSQEDVQKRIAGPGYPATPAAPFSRRSGMAPSRATRPAPLTPPGGRKTTRRRAYRPHRCADQPRASARPPTRRSAATAPLPASLSNWSQRLAALQRNAESALSPRGRPLTPSRRRQCRGGSPERPPPLAASRIRHVELDSGPPGCPDPLGGIQASALAVVILNRTRQLQLARAGHETRPAARFPC
jgi:hypothetical protein